MAKIQMKTPLVEMDGDEMTRILWKWIKEILLEPYIDLNTEYYDLGLEYREKQRTELPSTAPRPQKIRSSCKMRNDHSECSQNARIQSYRNVEIP